MPKNVALVEIQQKALLVWLVCLLPLLCGGLVQAEEISPPLNVLGFPVTQGAAPGFIDDKACAVCHREITQSYQTMGMAKSFAKPKAEVFIEDFANNHYYHAPSQRHYEMIRRGDQLFFKRYQLDAKNQPINVFETEVAWILGSGHQARSYLYRTENGELYQLPIGWYTQGRHWGMSPGFDQKDHFGLQRQVRRECLFCHNAYPEAPAGSDQHRQPQTFPSQLPEGIGCQRCHGPGAEHVRQAVSGELDPAKLRAAILNPGRLPPAQQLQVCYQCHMLPTVSMIGVRRFECDDYSFRPGQFLNDYLLHVDTMEEGSERGDRFEINHHPYRLAQSRCFKESQGALTCLNCHNPHRKTPESERLAHYQAACLKCHQPHQEKTIGIAQQNQDCVSCHMPRRRTRDVVQVVMTDHKIQRKPSGAELTAPLHESLPIITGVEFLEPERAPTGALAEVYRTVTVIRNRPDAGAIDWLRKQLPTAQPESLTPYFDLAKAQLKFQRYKDAEETLKLIFEKAPNDPLALSWAAVANLGAGKTAEAEPLLLKSLTLAPEQAETFHNLGLLLVSVGRYEEATKRLQHSLALRANNARGWMTLGNAYAKLGDSAHAYEAHKRALEIDPTLDRAYLGIAAALREKGEQAEARRYLEHGKRVARRTAQIVKDLATLGVQTPDH
ncbi:MAG: tetratricopeptide repeat protein [Candidatus Binatia bacterium]